MSVPTWWEFLLLAAAAWRIFQLLAHDEIFDRPRRWLLRMGNASQDEKGRWTGIPDEYRLKWALFLTCPYCAGFWIAGLWWVAWQISEHWTTVIATPFALSAAVIAGAKLLSSEESP